jgi:tRNA(Ile)-lysidine synthetase-like protein
MLTLAPRERVVGHRGTTSGRSLRSTAVEPAGPSQAAKITVPGTTFFDGWSVQAAVRSGVSGAPGDPLVAWMDPALAQGPLWVRHRRPGDRLQPLGFPGTRKLQDILVDAKVPRQARDAVPLLCQGDAILWVVGHRLAEAARVPDGSREVLVVDFRRSEERGLRQADAELGGHRPVVGHHVKGV